MGKVIAVKTESIIVKLFFKRCVIVGVINHLKCLLSCFSEEGGPHHEVRVNENDVTAKAIELWLTKHKVPG